MDAGRFDFIHLLSVLAGPTVKMRYPRKFKFSLHIKNQLQNFSTRK